MTVEPVESRSQLRRFADIPFVLHHGDDRWAPGVRAWEQWRLDARRHPHLREGDAAFLLARDAGRPVGRIAAHVDADRTVGRFGALAFPDDADVVVALVEAARAWLADEGVPGMEGPTTWADDEEAGVLVAGHEHPAATGRPWHPDWYGRRLVELGAEPLRDEPTWHLDLDDPAVVEALPEPPSTGGGPTPDHAGAYADPALVVEGAAAVPDVSRLLARASLRTAWRAARAARRGEVADAVVVRVEGEPGDVVPGLAAAARAAGYRRLLAPWTPVDRPPDRIHRTFRLPDRAPDEPGA